MQSKKFLLIFILLLFLILAKPLLFFADEIDYPTLPNTTTPTPEEGLPSYVNYIFNLALAIGGLVAFGVLIWGGVLYLTSAGNPEQIGNAKKKLIGALSGLFILFAVYLILFTINPDLVVLQLPEIIGTSPSTPSSPSESQELGLIFKEIPLGTIAESILAKNISCFDKDRNLIDCQQSECVVDNQHPGQYICQKGQILQTAAVENIFSNETDFRYCYQYDKNGNKEKLLENYDQYQCLQNLTDAIKIKTQKLIDLSNELNALLKNGCKCSSCSTGWCVTKRISGGCSFCDSHCSCCGNPRGTVSCEISENNSQGGYDPCNNRKAIDIKREEIKILIENGDPTDYDNDEYEGDVYNTAKGNLGVNEKFLSLNEAKRRIEDMENDLEGGLNDLKEAEELMKTPYGERLTLAEYFVLKQQSQIPVQKEEFKNYKIEKYCFYFNCNGATNSGLCNSCGLSAQKRMCRIETANNINVEDYVFLGDPATFYLIKQCKEYQDEASCKRANCNWSEDGCWGDTGQEYLQETAVGKSSLDIEEEKGFIKSLIPIGETVDEIEIFANKILSPVQTINENLQNVINAGINLYGLPEQCDCSRCTNNSICKGCGCCRRCDCDEPPCGCCASDDCCYGCTTCTPKQGESDYYVCPINEVEATIKNISKKVNDKDNYTEFLSINEQKDESKTTFTIDLDPNCESYAIQLLDSCDNSSWMRFYKTAVLERDGESLNYQIPAPEGPYSDYPEYWEVNRKTIGLGKYSSCQDPAIFYLDLLGEIEWSDSSKLIITLESNYKIDNNYNFQVTIKKSCPGYLQSIETAQQRLSNLIELKNLMEKDPNRCTLLDKLSLSRDRLEKCITGYGFTFKESSKKRIFSSKISLDLVYLGNWIILPEFPYPPLKGELNAYPYNADNLTDEQKENCKENKDSSKCFDYIKNLLENYYCLYE